MELRINSNASIKLDKFTGIKKINTRITEFLCKNDTLEGKILIYGSYYQQDLDKKHDFKEVIPFTVVFKDNNYTVQDIACENFSYGEVVGRGLDCNFDVVVTYEIKKEEVVPEVLEADLLEEARTEQVEKVEAELVETDASAPNGNLEAEIDTLPVEPLTAETEPIIVTRPAPVEDIISNYETEDLKKEDSNELSNDDYYLQNEMLKEDITKQVDKILQAKMEVKTDNDPSLKSKFFTKRDVKDTIKVIYYQDSKDIETICHQKNISIDKVFKDNKQTNFDQYRRIIIK